MVAHARDGGWAILLGKGTRGGVGRFLFRDGTIRLLTEYRQIDHLTEKRIELPVEFQNPPDDVTDSVELAGKRRLNSLWKLVDALGLPDLDAMAAEHRAIEDQRAASRILALDGDVAEAASQAQSLWEERQSHPCHECPRRNEHRDYLGQVDRLDKDRRALEEELGREIDLEEERLRNVIRGIRNVLHRFGYLHRGYPTEKADMLAEVFDSDGLILCELVDRGVLDNLPPEDLAELFSWFSFDREFRYGNRFVLPDRLVLARRRIEDVEHAVLSEERGEGLAISEGHNPNFYGAARAWSRGATMAEISAQIELSEGDLVMTFNKTIDLMRQVWEMLVSVKPEHTLRIRLQQAESLLRRDIVEHSLALGFAPIELPEIGRAELEAAKSAPAAASRRRARAAPAIVEPAPAEISPRDRKRAKEPTRRSVTTSDGKDPPPKKGRKGGSRGAPDESKRTPAKSGPSRARRSRTRGVTLT
jgi:ATP-dependent RNA helicase HelY